LYSQWYVYYLLAHLPGGKCLCWWPSRFGAWFAWHHVVHLVASISRAGFFQGQKWTAELSIPLDFLFLVTVYIYFLRGYWPSPPSLYFSPFFNKYVLERRHRKRVSVGCQPSWDASATSGCLTFLLALSKKN